MTPTRVSTLGLTALVAAAVAYLLVRPAYGSLPPLPGVTPLPLFLLAVVELGLARTVRQRLRAPLSRGRPLHPLQVARAAVLAKASSAGGALLLGAYGGLLAYLLPLQTEQSRDDAAVSGGALLASLALTAAALLLERACRTPDDAGAAS